MNERFESLAEEAMVHVPGSKGLHTRAFSLEKFAELIVQECSDVLLKWKNEPFPFDEDLAVSLIKEHFGIKK